jgi:hypothetical protein
MADNTIFIHGGASVSSFNGYPSSNVLNDLTKLVRRKGRMGYKGWAGGGG